MIGFVYHRDTTENIFLQLTLHTGIWFIVTRHAQSTAVNALALEPILNFHFLSRSTNKIVDPRQGSVGINGNVNDLLVRDMPLNVIHLDKTMATATHCPNNIVRILRANISNQHMISISWEVHCRTTTGF